RVEFASAFQTFAEKEIVETNAATVAVKPDESGEKIFTSWNIFRGFRYALQFGLAAAVLFFMLVGGWLWSENRRLSQQISKNENRGDEIPPRVEELQKQLQTTQTEKSEAEQELDKLREERRQLEDDLEREKSRKVQIPVIQKQSPEL